MLNSSKEIRALGLCSGGLDSILAAVVLRRQGIDVEWVSFETPFFSSESAAQASRNTGIPLHVLNITSVYLTMLKNPPCGYGQHMNPCIDCHTLMFKLAGEIMKDRGFQFLFSGEVLGQRPMSQTRSSLRYVEKHSGFDGYILRPLSACRLSETIAEKQGWVKRELLLDITGRSRKRQMELAEKFGINYYPTPASGCLLTDDGYSARLKDLFIHQDAYTESELYLLKYGRHLRLDERTKIIIGRNQEENENILRYGNPSIDSFMKAKNIPGPQVLIPYGGTPDNVRLAASICAAYGKNADNIPVDVIVTTPEGQEIINVIAVPKERIKPLIISA